MVAGDRAVRDARTTEKPIRDSRVQRVDKSTKYRLH
jgi:hypothetical protein